MWLVDVLHSLVLAHLQAWWSYLAEGLEALLMAMQTSRATAKTVFELLQCLTSSAHLPESDVARNELKLAQKQVVHCCSHLFCPQYPATEAGLVATGRLTHVTCGTYASKHIAKPLLSE